MIHIVKALDKGNWNVQENVEIITNLRSQFWTKILENGYCVNKENSVKVVHNKRVGVEKVWVGWEKYINANGVDSFIWHLRLTAFSSNFSLNLSTEEVWDPVEPLDYQS